MNLDISPIEFGRVLQKLDDIERELRHVGERNTFRLDNLEARVEVIERANAAAAVASLHQSDKASYWGKWVERAILALVAVGIGVVAGVRP